MKRLATTLLMSIGLSAVMPASAQEPQRDSQGRILLTPQTDLYEEGILREGPDDFYWDGSRFVLTKGSRPAAVSEKCPSVPEDAVNATFSPDSNRIAYTLGSDLYVMDVATGQQTRLTEDGTEFITNGYASWVYYEEILGRASQYKAFWWSADSRKIGFYRFDNTGVPVFPIYISDGQHGSLINTNYPKAGDVNPKVRIGMIDVTVPGAETVWADFNEDDDQYFGIPFWGADSKEFYIAHMPRVQNTLELFAVNATDGTKRSVYREEYPTWINWMEEIVFEKDGLYMVRDFEGWQQIYFLPYDGSGIRRITDGNNWTISIVAVNHSKGDVYFLAKRASTVRRALYKADRKGRIIPLTDEAFNVAKAEISDDFKQFAVSLSNGKTPYRLAVYSLVKKNRDGSFRLLEEFDSKGERFGEFAIALPELISITTPDGFTLPGQIIYPLNFDPQKKYPVHINIYGGPDAPQVRDIWKGITDATQWWAYNGIIQITIDNRAGGHAGRKGLDMIYRNLMEYELSDFIEWAKYLRSLPYVRADKLGVEGFSFGGTMTVMCLTKGAEYFSYGIAGGGVYDWMLYDSHYTERYMDTPERNPEGYANTVIKCAGLYPTEYGDSSSKPDHMLKITHGTADDNVHFQQTMQLIDELQRLNKNFEFMIYPEGKHGYKGYQGEHFDSANKDFWLRWLKD